MICSEECGPSLTIERTLDARALTVLAPALEQELRKRVESAVMSRLPSPLNKATLAQVLARVRSGRCTDEEQRRYFLFVAPLARRVLLEHAARAHARRRVLIDADQVQRWLVRLESFDPLSAAMVDLRYFARLSLKDTAHVVGVTKQTVVQDLRFARAWLAIGLGWPSRRRL